MVKFKMFGSNLTDALEHSKLRFCKEYSKKEI